MVIDRTTGKGCAWSIAARTIARRLEADGIVDQVIAKRPYYKSHIFLRVASDGRELRVYSLGGDNPPEGPLWVPSFLDAGLWQQAAQKFRVYRGLDENILHYLLPEMEDYLQSIPHAELVSMTRDFLIEYGVINQPIRQRGGVTTYFNENAIYSLDKAKRFPIEGRLKFHLFDVSGTGAAFFSNSVWRKAASSFEAGMTLDACIEIFLKTKMVHQAPRKPSPVDRLVQYITPPVYERVPGNNNEATFDRIRITVGLPRYQFDSWEALRDEVKTYQREIAQRVVQKLEESPRFKRYCVPVNFLKLSNITLLRDFSLEFIFELKDSPAKAAAFRP